MTINKFETEINTLKNFYELYCKDNHTNQESIAITLAYKEKLFLIELNLCENCQKAIDYSFVKLQNCPHEIKPRCRRCPNPCYDKENWKETAKVMKYAAIKLSLGKIKSRILKIFD